MTATVARLPSPVLPAAPTTNISQATAVEQSRAIAEVQAAIVVAQQCPRDMRRAWEEMEQACSRLGLASRAFYAVPNRGSGPSVHLAREIIRIWGNVDYGVRELRRDDAQEVSEVQAYAWDQQTNVRSTRSFIVPHARMKKKDGKNVRETLVDLGDIYLNNQNVGARAVRECIFTVLPSDYVALAQELCRETIERGDGKPLPERIALMVAGFAELGVTVKQIEARLERKRGHWTAVDVADLSVVYSSIKRREATVDEMFPPDQDAARVTAADITNGRPKPAEPVSAPLAAPTDPQPAPMSEEQKTRMVAAMVAAGLGTRTHQQAFIKNEMGRTVGQPDLDWAELTSEDAEHITAAALGQAAITAARAAGGDDDLNDVRDDGPLSKEVTAQMATLFHQTPMAGDSTAQFAWISEKLDRKVTARKQMTDGDGKTVVAALREYVTKENPPVEGPQQ